MTTDDLTEMTTDELHALKESWHTEWRESYHAACEGVRRMNEAGIKLWEIRAELFRRGEVCGRGKAREPMPRDVYAVNISHQVYGGRL